MAEHQEYSFFDSVTKSFDKAAKFTVGPGNFGADKSL